MTAFPASSFGGPTLISKWLGATNGNASTAASKLVVGPERSIQAVLNGRLTGAASLGPYWVVAVGEPDMPKTLNLNLRRASLLLSLQNSKLLLLPTSLAIMREYLPYHSFPKKYTITIMPSSPCSAMKR